MWRLVLVAALAAASARAEEPGWSLSGSGLLTLPSTATLAPGRFTLGLALDNKDRDPLGLDVFDYSAAFSLGLGKRTEAYGRYVFSRVVALPERPALPPPPLDLIVPAGGAVPPRPYYALYAPAPYVNWQGRRRFDQFVPGDVVLGLKRRLADPAGARPGLAASAEIKIPASRALDDLRSGSGTGGTDASARLTAEWRAGRGALLASVGFTHVGAPAFGDRLVFAGPGAGPRVVELPLELPDRLDVGVGFQRPLTQRLAAVAEATASFEVGRRTPVLDAIWPLDALAGIQLRLGRLRLTAGLRYHGHDAPSGARRTDALAGLVDLTGVSDDALAAYLGGLGLGDAVGSLRPGSQRLLAVRDSAAALPPGARLLPATYGIRSEHQMGIVVACGVRF